jgi:hypothetical protein
MTATMARSVGKIVHPRQVRARVVIVLKAYLNASGTTDSEQVIGVAGWAGTEARQALAAGAP